MLQMLYTWILVCLCTFWIHGESIHRWTASPGKVMYQSIIRTKRQACRGLLYCGHEESSGKTVDNNNLVPNDLYRKCDDGKFSFHSKCQNGCTPSASSDSYCQNTCTGSLYCGHESPTGKTIHNSSLVPNDLYRKCGDGKFSLHSKCQNGCKRSSPDSYCQTTCTGHLHCGHEETSGKTLNNMDLVPNDLYRKCSDGKFSFHSKCQYGCTRSSPDSYCQATCTGSLYCGHEEPSGKTIDNNDLLPNYLYNKCGDGKFSFHSKCPNGCKVSSFDSYCHPTCTGSPDCEYDSPSGKNRMDCGIQFQSSQQRQFVKLINNGIVSQHGQWPWIVSILYNGRHFCGGTLIMPQWVLSAAHCFDNTQTGIVVLGALNPSRVDETGQVRVKIDRVISHPQYTTSSMKYDIALVRLKTPVQYSRYIRPACLPSSNQGVNINTTCVVTGWGYTLGEKIPANLQEAKITIVSNDRCLPENGDIYVSETGRRFPFTEDMICTAPVEDKQGLTCRGDSGGPLLCKQGSTWIVQGITSYGDIEACLSSDISKMTSVFTRVASYLSWIEQETRDLP